MNTKMLADFQMCISVPLIRCFFAIRLIFQMKILHPSENVFKCDQDEISSGDETRPGTKKNSVYM